MTKLVINICYGGFSVSIAAARRMAELGHTLAKASTEEYDRIASEQGRRATSVDWYGNFCRSTERNDPVLIQVVEELGRAANGELAALKVVEIPDDVKWQIEEYDGNEWVAEEHRTWS